MGALRKPGPDASSGRVGEGHGGFDSPPPPPTSLAEIPWFTSAEYDELIVRCSDATFQQARTIAADHAEELGDAWSRTRYTGRHDLPIHDDSCPAGVDWEGCEACLAVPCWTFELYEGSYRG